MWSILPLHWCSRCRFSHHGLSSHRVMTLNYTMQRVTPETSQCLRVVQCAPTHDDVMKWKHFPRNWPFVRGIHRSPVNSPHKGQWRHIGWASLNPWPDHFCWNMLSYSGLATRLHCPHSRFPGESHMSEQPLFSQVVFQWLCNQMQSAWGVAAVKLWTF